MGNGQEAPKLSRSSIQISAPSLLRPFFGLSILLCWPNDFEILDWKMHLAVVSLIHMLTLRSREKLCYPSIEFRVHCRELYTLSKKEGRQTRSLTCSLSQGIRKWDTGVTTSQSSSDTIHSFNKSPFAAFVDVFEISFPDNT